MWKHLTSERWVIELPKSDPGEANRVYDFSDVTGGWKFIDADSTVRTLIQAVPSANVRTEARATYTGSTLIQTNWRQFTTNTGHERLTQEVRGSGTAARTNS